MGGQGNAVEARNRQGGHDTGVKQQVGKGGQQAQPEAKSG